jgi:hypothetical protein
VQTQSTKFNTADLNHAARYLQWHLILLAVGLSRPSNSKPTLAHHVTTQSKVFMLIPEGPSFVLMSTKSVVLTHCKVSDIVGMRLGGMY